jgi:putative Holliday junction resolvase
MNYLKQVVQEKNVSTIVLGEPKRLNASDSSVTQNVYLLKEALQKEFPSILIELYDERFTSKMAFQSLIDSKVSKKKRMDKGLIDEVSATIILQSYMQSISL